MKLILILLLVLISGCSPKECIEPIKYDEQVQSCGCKFVNKTKCGENVGHSIFYCEFHASDIAENNVIAEHTIRNMQEHGTPFDEK